MSTELAIPEIRIRRLNDASVAAEQEFVLYWMVAHRRCLWNFGLQRAVEVAAQLNKPLVVLEALRCDYRWASDRLHWFVIQGMADNAQHFADAPVYYFPYLEPEPGAGDGLLLALADSACAVVSDDFPCFFLPRMQARLANRLPVRFEVIDSNGLLPMRATDRVFARAVDLRRFLQKELPNHLPLSEFPKRDPFQDADLPSGFEIPRSILKRWPAAKPKELFDDSAGLSRFPIDHQVGLAAFDGGERAARAALDEFLDERLEHYAEQRNQPEEQATSGLSPYLHFGHISVHEVFHSLVAKVGWTLGDVAEKANGSRSGWWGVEESVEGFLDELITWRELGFNMCSKRDDYARYSSLPDWARQTLADHAADARDFTYSLAEFEAAKTHDDLWNAAQTQLVSEGRMHNYLRMLWGKKILHWSATPQQALQIMIELNNKYAVDGRNPNSYSGILWVLGRYDRPWGPERPIFGKIRYMTSESTRKKFRVDGYIQKYAPGHGNLLF